MNDTASYYNSRTCEGCDYALSTGQASRKLLQSPPVRGATRLSPIVIDTLQLQLTHPRGVRLHGTFLLLVLWCFNSRAREGCDLQSCNISPALAPSTLAPREGVRLLRRPVRTSAEVLQLTHPRGVRPYGVRFKIYRNSFNSCTREGCDRRSALTTATATRLQLTLSCGERRYIPRWFSLCCSYNSRSPAESDVNKLLLPANDLATTPALLRRATVIDDFAVHSNAATTHALLRRATVILTEFVIRCYIKLWELAKSICLRTRI